MLDILSLKNELTSVVNNLAKSVVTEIITAAEKCTLNKQTQGSEEELDALVDELCVEAIDKILRIVELVNTAKQQHDPLSIKRSNKSSQTGDDLNTVQAPQGKDHSGPKQPEPQTLILICANPVTDKRNPLVPAKKRDTGKKKPCEPVAEAAESNDDADADNNNDDDEPSTPPPTPPECADHGYARPSSPPNSSPASSDNENSAASAGATQRNKKRKVKKAAGGGGKRKKDASLKPEMVFQHQCTRCTMIFPSDERLQEHARKAHPVCTTCGALFTSVPNLREHELKEHGIRPFGCEYCGKGFTHRAHLNVHVKSRHTGERPCQCDVCGKSYSCVSLLKTHRLTHFDKTYVCDVCGKSFYHACHLTRHKQVHQDVKPYQCTFCGKGFTQAANLKAHHAVHTDEKQLCSICGKSYRGLKNHMISKHSHELAPDELPAAGKRQPFTCATCGKKFLLAAQYKAHRRTHTGDKPFSCDVCGKSYRMKETLRDHKYTHTDEKPYRCATCDKTFNTSTSFMRHKSIHSGETPYSCTVCGKDFRLLTFLKAHEQSLGHRRRAIAPAAMIASASSEVEVTVGEEYPPTDHTGSGGGGVSLPAHEPKWHNKKPRSNKKSKE